MKRVLVTGASGFIGRAVIRQLALDPDFCVYGVISGRHKICFEDNITIVKADLLCQEETTNLIKTVKADICVHLAWELPGNDEFQFSAKNLSWLQASLHLFQKFAENGGKRFVFAGSSSEYGIGTGTLKETAKPLILSLYGETKRAFTETVQTFCIRQGIEFACARYFSIYGEYDVRPARAIPYVIQQLLEGKRATCKSPNSIWDYLYIEDAAKATAKLVKSSITGPINIGSGVPSNLSEVFQTVAQIIGHPELVDFLSTNAGGQILVADTDRLCNELGFRPSIGLREGLERTIRWWKEAGLREL